MSVVSPDTPVIVYDGHCNLCSGWARFHARHPLVPPFSLVAMQSDIGRALLAANGIDPDDPLTFLVIDRGRRMTESDAAIHVVTELGGAWRLIEIVRSPCILYWS